MSVTIPASDHSPITRSRAVVDHVVPTGREEEWRFTPLARLGGLHLGTVDLSAPLDINVTAEGFVVDHVSHDDSRVGVAFEPTDIVAAQAMASAGDVVILTLPREAQGRARRIDHAHDTERAVAPAHPAGIRRPHRQLPLLEFLL